MFADSCRIDSNTNKTYFCSCHTGYTGTYCETCAAGYYGEPTAPGGKCLPCRCNDNINMNDAGACDQRSGACLKCENNTAGETCGECAAWHYGEAIGAARKCEACTCDKCGTAECERASGECKCKKNVVGERCDKCAANTWGLRAAASVASGKCGDDEGCRECACDPIGSVSPQCDQLSGQCKCKPGVGGMQCDACLPDHWQFTDAGCTNCNCSRAGVQVTHTGGFRCNATTGHCKCIEGVTGEKCDMCQPRWALVKHVGCKRCDTCVATLLDTVDELSMNVDKVARGNERTVLIQDAHTRLQQLADRSEQVRARIANASALDATPFASLHRGIRQAERDVVQLARLVNTSDVSEKMVRMNTLLEQAHAFAKQLNDLRLRLDFLDTILTELDSPALTAPVAELPDDQVNKLDELVKTITERDTSRATSSSSAEYEDLLKQLHTCESSRGSVGVSI